MPAAIFLKETAAGLQVWDQWRSGHVGERKDTGYRHGIGVCRFVDAEGKKSII